MRRGGRRGHDREKGDRRLRRGAVGGVYGVLRASLWLWVRGKFVEEFRHGGNEIHGAIVEELDVLQRDKNPVVFESGVLRYGKISEALCSGRGEVGGGAVGDRRMATGME